MPDSVWLVLFFLGLAGFLWTAANAIESWRLLRRSRKPRGLRLVISNPQPTTKRETTYGTRT